jgi:glycosyltransferase involved in cell wall biosynthesis
LAAWRAKVPVVINTQHGRGCGDRWKNRIQFRIANRFTDRVVGVSDDALQLCRGQNPGSADKMVRIWNGIDVGRFKFHGPASKPAAISVARLSPEKDFGTLLQAAAVVRSQIPEFTLTIVGDGVERDRLEKQCDELNLRSTVEFLGERSDIPSLLAKAGFFVSSSKTEGVSLTLLEAMSVGLPIVTTNVGGNPEIVEPGLTGWLAPSQDPLTLAGEIIRMCREPEKWAAMGQAGRERIERDFNIRTTMARYESLYDQLLYEKQV